MSAQHYILNKALLPGETSAEAARLHAFADDIADEIGGNHEPFPEPAAMNAIAARHINDTGKRTPDLIRCATSTHSAIADRFPRLPDFESATEGRRES